MQPGITPSTGIQYPSVVLGGVTYQMKFSMASQMLMEKRGLSVSNLKELAGETTRRVSLTIEFAACMLGNDLGDGRWKTVAMDPLELADMAPDDINARAEWVRALAQGVVSAFAKVRPVVGPGQAPSAEVTPATN